MVNRIWPTAVAGEADSVSSVSASACHIGGPNSVNPGQILLVYGTSTLTFPKNLFQKIFLMLWDLRIGSPLVDYFPPPGPRGLLWVSTYPQMLWDKAKKIRSCEK